MSPAERDMIADRELRDAALALLKADIDIVRHDMSAKGIADRVTGRLTDGALEVFEDATALAENNRGVLATLLAAVGIWFARNPILSAFGFEPDGLDGKLDPEGMTKDNGDDADPLGDGPVAYED